MRLKVEIFQREPSGPLSTSSIRSRSLVVVQNDRTAIKGYCTVLVPEGRDIKSASNVRGPHECCRRSRREWFRGNFFWAAFASLLAATRIRRYQFEVMIGARNGKELHIGRLDQIVNDGSTLAVLQHRSIKNSMALDLGNHNSDMVQAKIGKRIHHTS